MKCIGLLLALVCLSAWAEARITIRHRRQVEREEGSSGSSAPASEVVVIKDTVNPNLPGPLFLVPRIPGPGDAFDLDINEQDGTFTFGGLLPPHMHHFHSMQRQSFGDLFQSIQRRFDEMTRNMMSFNNFGPSFNPTTDIASLPDDYNKTDSEIVELGGVRYVKKTTTLKRGGPGSSFFVRSTTFERVNDNDNADLPTKGEEVEKEEDDKKKDVKPEESQPQAGVNSSTTSTPSPKDESERESDSSPKEPAEAVPSDSGPDVVPSASSSETPAVVSDASEEEESAPQVGDERQLDASSASSTPQP